MKVSILGSNGFLSTEIAKYANKVGWELDVYGLTQPENHTYDNFYKIDLVTSDLEYKDLMDSDMIVYTIGAGIQANLKESADLIYKLNVTVPVSICNKLNTLGYSGCFVSFGSVFEMGETSKTTPFTEADIMTSQSPAPNDYTTSKRMFSRFVSSYKHKFIHWHFIIPTIYGKGENPKRLIPYVVNSLKNNQKLSFTSGEQIRQYLHVSEVPVILKLSYDYKLPSGVYNISGSEILSVKEIVELIHKQLDKVVPTDCFGSLHRADIGMKYLVLDGERLKRTIGYEPHVNIREVLHEYQSHKLY